MSTIIGVDFSGRQDDLYTWVAQGRMTRDGALRLNSVQPVRRADVYRLLAATRTPAVVAMDFPFGVPADFAGYLSPDGALHDAMPDVWRTVAGMTLADFIAARHEFVAIYGEVKRAGDAAYFSESFSPLHGVIPNMMPMTYYGTRMLHDLHQARPAGWFVPPLEPPDQPAVTLLELMPGAFLNAVGFDRTVSKGYKRGRYALENRSLIIRGLPDAAGIKVLNMNRARLGCRASDDCLDAVIAAVGAAMWAQDCSRFHCPSDDELPAARLEGWIYAPGLPPAPQQPD